MRLRAVMVGCVMLAWALPAAAQQHGSRYISTDSWVYDALTQLKTRGYLRGLDPLAQPYTRDEVRRALATTDSTTLPSNLRHYYRLLHQELGDTAALGFAAYAGAHVSSTRRLDPLLPLRAERKMIHAWPYYSPEGWAEKSVFAIDIRLYHDLWYEGCCNHGDPDGRDPGGIEVFNRTDNAYLSVAHPLGTFVVGRFHHNWAPLGMRGLMISDVATTYPQIALDVGGKHLAMRYFLGELDSLHATYRYIAANQVEYRNDNFSIAVAEAKVFGFANQGIRLRELDPVELIFFDQDQQPYNGVSNGIVSGTLWWHTGGTTIRGEGMLDDIDVTPPPGRKREPTLFALGGGVHNTSLVPSVELALDYEVVSAYAFRTPYQNRDQWSFFQRGVGANFSDYDRLTASASVIRGPLRLTPALTLQRKGEGDWRLPVPDSAHYYGDRTLFLGVREQTIRAALRGRYQPTRNAYAEWDGGFNFVKNADHVRDRKLTEFQGVLRVGFEWETN